MSTPPPVPPQAGLPPGVVRKKSTNGWVIVLIVVGAGFMFVMFIGVVAAIAIPGLLRARMAANESAAIGMMRSIASAQAVYAAECGSKGSFSPSFEALARPNATKPGSAPYLSVEGAQPTQIERSGYVFNLISESDGSTERSCNGVAAGEGVRRWVATATPLRPRSSGTRYFAVNASGVVYVADSEFKVSAEAYTPLPPATPLQ
jgi:type IV pilus assembly protein PilA